MSLKRKLDEEEICHFEKLPIEIIEKIFSFLDYFEFINCSFVSKKWKAITDAININEFNIKARKFNENLFISEFIRSKTKSIISEIKQQQRTGFFLGVYRQTYTIDQFYVVLSNKLGDFFKEISLEKEIIQDVPYFYCFGTDQLAFYEVIKLINDLKLNEYIIKINNDKKKLKTCFDILKMYAADQENFKFFEFNSIIVDENGSINRNLIKSDIKLCWFDGWNKKEKYHRRHFNLLFYLISLLFYTEDLDEVTLEYDYYDYKISLEHLQICFIQRAFKNLRRIIFKIPTETAKRRYYARKIAKLDDRLKLYSYYKDVEYNYNTDVFELINDNLNYFKQKLFGVAQLKMKGVDEIRKFIRKNKLELIEISDNDEYQIISCSFN